MKYTWILALIVLILTSCSQETVEISDHFQLICDAEEVVENEFIIGDDRLGGGQGRSDEYARSGKYSLKLDETRPFGFSHKFENIKKGDVIEVQVWVSLEGKDGEIVIADEQEESQQYYSRSNYVEEGNGWGRIHAFYVAQNDYDLLNVYAYNSDKKAAYFDDIEINVYRNNSIAESEDVLDITIPKSAMDSIVDFRSTALEQKVITSDLKEYFKAELTIGGKKIPVELRIKGDWTDHLETNKWSFRIKTKKGFAYKGMRTFSIQHPGTRAFMYEWFAHKLYEHEDVLTTRYTFIPVVINGEQKGVYALEEHFDKQLLEHRKRREGPIVKFDESGVWDIHLEERTSHETYSRPALESAEILPFKKNRTFKSPTLSKQFKLAQSHMLRYRNHDPAVNEYYDINATAKWLALTDVLNGKHGLIWHNQRNYFNPVTSRLEPIAYDCFMSLDQLMVKADLSGYERKDKERFTAVQALFSNSLMEKEYIKYLEKFADEKFLNGVFKDLEDEIAEVEQLITSEYPSCGLDKAFFENNCAQIRSQLTAYKKFAKNPNQEKYSSNHMAALPEGKLFENIALKVNTESVTAQGKHTMTFTNYHSDQITVVGYTVKGQKDLVKKIRPVTLRAFDGTTEQVNIQLPEKPRRIVYEAKNCPGQTFKAKPSKWQIARELRVFQEHPDLVQPLMSGNELRFSGNHSFKRDVVIPAGRKVVIEPGSTLDFTNGAGFISYSPVFINGDKDSTVQIISSDESAGGFTVLAAGERSEMYYTTFKGFGTVNKDYWTLTGAVTFYEADLTIDHCNFVHNNCEDGLNLIRCDFNMINSYVAFTTSDGFDADFCTGVVNKSTFENTGNDCIDFSGSEILVKNCEIIDAGDKGISGGEDSHLVVDNCSIYGAHIAIASKDLSTVEVKNCSIIKSKYGFAAYRKKPEYGPAKLEVTNMKKMNAQHLHLLELESTLMYEGKKYVGDRKFDIDAMYAMYEK